MSNVIAEFNHEDLIFALDIGTRTVVGIVGVQEQDKFQVLSAEIVEHRRRAMLDGQIHDINQVTQAVSEVKQKLEKNLGIKLKKVAIAAAGRVLKTCQAKVEREVDTAKEIDQKLIGSIEIEAVQKAQDMLAQDCSKEEAAQFYCIGYSVTNYYLNEYIISNLLGHRGNKIGVDVLATFLPHMVVDSLYTVMKRVGLEVASLTLEPIAAINVAIPKDLRMLNLALVDIGAGTSDIAITKKGTVVAYAMVPIAGDEITEAIAQNYLVDFNTAEKIKKSLTTKKENVTFTDVLGKKSTACREEILDVIQEPLEILGSAISTQIMEYNNKAPNAVFLIGGGSQIPGLENIISQKLGLPKERVAVRGRDIIRNIKFRARKLSGPESITPFGIAITSQMNNGHDFLTVKVNNKTIRLFNPREQTVADALILTGFNARDLIGTTGKSITFTLNGVEKVVKGEYGEAATIFVNDMPASMETVINIGDNIRVVAARHGKSAQAKVSDFLKRKEKIQVTFNGKQLKLDPEVFINGKSENQDSIIKNGDTVDIVEIINIKDLMSKMGLNISEYDVRVNGKHVESGYLLHDKDVIEYSNKKQSIVNNRGTKNMLDEMVPKAETASNKLYMSNVLSVFVNGKKVRLEGTKSRYIFVDIFNYIDFDLSKPRGNIEMKLNGKKAAFTDIIKNGDVIDIYWVK